MLRISEDYIKCCECGYEHPIFRRNRGIRQPELLEEKTYIIETDKEVKIISNVHDDINL